MAWGAATIGALELLVSPPTLARYRLNALGNPTGHDLSTGTSRVVQTDHPPGMGGFGQGYGRRLTWASQLAQPIPGRPKSWIVIAYDSVI